MTLPRLQQASLIPDLPSTRGSVIQWDGLQSWDATQRRALGYAASLWEEQLRTIYPQVRIRVGFLPKESPLLVQTTISPYSQTLTGPQKVGENSYTLPLAYVKNYMIEAPQLTDHIDLSEIEQKEDISLLFNPDSTLFYWGTDAMCPADRFDFVTVAIREMAKAMGIVSSAQTDIEGNLLIHPRQKILQLDACLGLDRWSSQSADLLSQLTAADGVKSISSNSKPTVSYPLYAPANFESGRSLNYFEESWAIDNGLEFLKPHLHKGEAYHRIGQAITALMDDILQWKKPDDMLLGYPEQYQLTNTQVVEYQQGVIMQPIAHSSKLAKASILSSYPHNTTEDETIDQWRLEILTKAGIFQSVKTQSEVALPFEVIPEQITDSEQWARSIEGDLRARVYYKNQHPATYTYLYLDYLPETPELTVSSIYGVSTNDPCEPMPLLGYKALGAKELTVMHESEDGTQFYTLNPDGDRFVLTNIDPYIENSFTLLSNNNNGYKISKVVVWGGFESTSLSDINAETDLSLYPNPTINQLNMVGLAPTNSLYQTEIIDLSGRLVYKTMISADTPSVNVETLEKGTYLLRIFGENQPIRTLSFIKK